MTHYFLKEHFSLQTKLILRSSMLKLNIDEGNTNGGRVWKCRGSLNIWTNRLRRIYYYYKIYDALRNHHLCLL